MFLNTIVKTGKLDLINENLAHSDMIDEANAEEKMCSCAEEETMLLFRRSIAELLSIGA